MKDKFEIVSTDIIDLITNLHYEDKEQELIKLNIELILYKMLENENIFEDNIKALNKNLKEEGKIK